MITEQEKAEIRTKAFALGAEITKLVNEFEAETQTVITSLDIDRQALRTFSDSTEYSQVIIQPRVSLGEL